MRLTIRLLALSIVGVLALGCSGETVGGGVDARVSTADRFLDAALADAVPRDALTRDALARDALARDAGSADGSSVDAGGVSNAFGFAMRLPVEHTLSCVGVPPHDQDQIVRSDMDWICTFRHGGIAGHIYLQSTPVTCVSFGLSQGAEYEGHGAFISVDGRVSATSDAGYDWGANHHVDSLGFSYDGRYFRYGHSSVDYSFHPCHAMDCIRVFDRQGGTLIEDGCTSARSLPVVCHRVEVGASYDTGDFTDTFARCPGDTR
jgi:hypothetical protein